MCNNIFKFTFICNNLYDRETMSVYSEYEEYINIFLNQHTFDVEDAVIECINKPKEIIASQKILSPFKFKSNKLSGEYIIISTDEIIEECVLGISHDLDCLLVFGQAVSYHKEIDIFNNITNLVDKLPHTFIIDNPDSYEVFSMFANNNDRLDSYINNPNEAKIYQSIMHRSKSNIMNISLEGYVNAFTSLIIEKYIYK